MYRIILAIFLFRGVFGLSTTPVYPGSEDTGGDIIVIANNGGTGKGDLEIANNGYNAEKIEAETFVGHGALEAEMLKEEEMYNEWLAACVDSDDIPDINDEVKKYLETMGMTVDGLKNRCNEMKKSGGNGRKRYIFNNNGIWHRCIIPFIFDESMTDKGIKAVKEVHKEIEKKTGFRFVPSNNSNAALGLDHNTTVVYKLGACRSYMGNNKPANNLQEIYPCEGFTIALHEIGHLLGFEHEQNDPASYLLMKANFDNQYKDSFWSINIHPSTQVYDVDNFYDLTSYLHYKNAGSRKGYGQIMMTDEQELTDLIAKNDYYYMFRYLQKYNKCYDEFSSCTPLPVCENDGYPSVIEGVCGCACPEGLDPATKCTTIVGDSNIYAWPEGTYSLLRVKGYDCPAGFEFGQMAFWNEYDQWGSGRYISEGRKNAFEFVYDVCTKTSSVGNRKWPEGRYCVLKRGDCPDGFSEGVIELWGKEPDRENSSYGALPDGKKGQDMELVFCCRNDGPKEPIKLPTKEPFILYDSTEIEGMYRHSDSTISRSSKKTQVVNGSLPYHSLWYGSTEIIWITYSAYYPVTKEIDGKPCGEIKHFTVGEKTYTFNTPNYPENYPARQECLWYIESPTGTTMKIEFPDFEVSSVDDIHCNSYVELKTVEPGITGYRICGHHEKKSRLTVYNKLMVKFKSSNMDPQKGFKAIVTVLSEAEQCYTGTGLNYAGTINYTRNMNPCLPWSEVTNCAFNKFASSVLNLDLSGNNCRTPLLGRMPWCYVNKELCIRENCDVCMRDQCYDVLPNCANIVTDDSAFCTKNELGEAKRGCMKTCGFCDQFKPVAAYSTVTCSAPGDVTSINPTPAKTSYNVGDEVEYKCPSSNVVRKRTCRSDGKWSPLSYVCSGCTAGYTYIRGRCYKWMGDVKQNYWNARWACKKINASLLVVESDEQLEGVMGLTKYDRLDNDNVWLGLQNVDGVWKWEDGTNTNYVPSWRPDADPTKLAWAFYGSLPPNSMKESGWGATLQVVCGVKPTGTFECEDEEPTCSDVLAQDPDMCETYPSYAWIHCRKTCGVQGCTGTSTCTVPTVANGQQVKGGSSVNQGQFVEFKCNDGFYLKSGNLKRTCLSTGSFNGEEPVCAGPSDVSSVTLFSDAQFFPRNLYKPLNRPVVANLDSTRLTTDGKITAWAFFASEAGVVTLLVWRPNPTNNQEFTLVGMNTLTVTADNRAVKMSVSAGDQISVKKGDVIGLLLSKPVITYNECNKNEMPQYTPWQSTTQNYQPAELEINKAYTFVDNWWICRVYSIHVTVDPA